MSEPRLEYPCRFPIKVFVRPSAETETRIEALVRGALPDATPVTVERRSSRSGHYLCLTLTFTARDAEQVRRVGAAVRDADGVLLAI